MTKAEAKEQLQENVLTILEGFGIDEAMEGSDYDNLVNVLCDTIVDIVNKID
jgi:hypothetical protein